MSRLPCLFLTLGALLISAAAPRANDVATSFEFDDIDGAFTLGTVPRTVTFLGGEAKSIGIPSLYVTGVRAWMMRNANMGTILFETPAQTVTLFFRNQNSAVAGVLTAFDVNDTAVATVTGTNSFQLVVIDVQPGELPISRITVEHSGSPGHAVVENFSFCAAPLVPFLPKVAGTAGSGGVVPIVTGSGPLTTLSANSVELTNALANRTTALVFGLSELGAPFKGGTLLPFPDIIHLGLATDGAGNLSVPFVLPASFPTGMSMYFQFWVNDPAGIQGFAGSNGLRGTSS